jgi:hypothetical protein
LFAGVGLMGSVRVRVVGVARVVVMVAGRHFMRSAEPPRGIDRLDRYTP